MVKTFPEEDCISFCGFKARVNRGRIMPGDYNIKAVCNNKIANVDKRNDYSVEELSVI